MDEKLEASSVEFVIKPEDPENFAMDLEKSGNLVEVTELDGERELFVIRSDCNELEGRGALKKVQEETGENNVSPALIDAEGNVLYPTGDIQVRFDEVLDDDALEEFSKEHGLALKGRNEFQPLQVKFEMAEPKEKVLIEELELLNRQPKVSKAWPITMNRYRRGK